MQTPEQTSDYQAGYAHGTRVKNGEYGWEAPVSTPEYEAGYDDGVDGKHGDDPDWGTFA